MGERGEHSASVELPLLATKQKIAIVQRRGENTMAQRTQHGLSREKGPRETELEALSGPGKKLRVPSRLLFSIKGGYLKEESLNFKQLQPKVTLFALRRLC